MKAIYKKPGEQAKIIDIKNTLKALQEAVNGYIETFTFASDACIVCNQEGAINDMPFNCRILGQQFFGPILIVGVSGNNFTDLYAADAVLRMFFGGSKQ